MNALLDTLIPGDDDVPAASTVGLHDALLAHDRFAEPYNGVVACLPEGFDEFTFKERSEAVLEVEAWHPALFNSLIVGAYSLYYTQPRVAGIIETLTGHTALPPQPAGHPLPPFDPKLVAVPAARAPHYRATPEIKDA
jgi:hypothetical protein